VRLKGGKLRNAPPWSDRLFLIKGRVAFYLVKNLWLEFLIGNELLGVSKF